MKKIIVALLLLVAVGLAGATPLTAIVPDHTPSNAYDFSHMYVYTQKSPLNPIEYDRIFIGHNNTTIFLAAKMYDLDNANNLVVKFYITNGVNTYYVLAKEGNTTASVYTSTGTFVETVPEHSIASTHDNPFCTIVVDVPYTLVNSTTAKVLVERNLGMCHCPMCMFGHWSHCHSPHPESIWYPVPPVFTTTLPPTTDWIPVTFAPAANATLTINIPKALPYMTLIINNSTSAMQIPVTGSGNYSVPAPTIANISVVYAGNAYTTGISGFAVLNKTSVNTTVTPYVSLSLSHIYTFNVDNSTITLVAQGTVSGNTVNGTLELTSTGTFVSAWTDARAVVMRARELVYNPLTHHYQFYVERTVYVKPIQENFMILMAPSVDMLKVCKHKVQMCVCGNGTVVVANPVNGTFAVVHNGTAMKRHRQYRDMANYTMINTTAGNLTIYYTNPCNVSVKVNATAITVSVKTPYTFHGRINVTVGGKQVVSKNVTIAYPGGNYTIALSNLSKTTGVKALAASGPVVTVYDLDSQKVIGSESIKLTQFVEQWFLALVIVLLVVVAGAALYFVRKSKKAAVREIEKRGKYFRKRN